MKTGNMTKKTSRKPQPSSQSTAFTREYREISMKIRCDMIFISRPRPWNGEPSVTRGKVALLGFTSTGLKAIFFRCGQIVLFLCLKIEFIFVIYFFCTFHSLLLLMFILSLIRLTWLLCWCFFSSSRLYGLSLNAYGKAVFGLFHIKMNFMRVYAQTDTRWMGC